MVDYSKSILTHLKNAFIAFQESFLVGVSLSNFRYVNVKGITLWLNYYIKSNYLFHQSVFIQSSANIENLISGVLESKNDILQFDKALNYKIIGIEICKRRNTFSYLLYDQFFDDYFARNKKTNAKKFYKNYNSQIKWDYDVKQKLILLIGFENLTDLGSNNYFELLVKETLKLFPEGKLIDSMTLSETAPSNDILKFTVIQIPE